jgi:hypothetical protein
MNRGKQTNTQECAMLKVERRYGSMGNKEMRKMFNVIARAGEANEAEMRIMRKKFHA